MSEQIRVAIQTLWKQ